MVFSPLGDNQAAVIGAGGDRADTAVLNLGTGGQISIFQNDWQTLDGFETRPMPGEAFLLVGASLCGGWVYAYLKDFYKDVIKRITGVTVRDQGTLCNDEFVFGSRYGPAAAGCKSVVLRHEKGCRAAGSDYVHRDG